MAEPFRDGLEAALERAERLADENDDLRTELERVKHDAAEQATPAKPDGVNEPRPPDSTSTRIFAHLDELAKERDGRADVPPIIPTLSQPTLEEPHAEARIAEPAVSPEIFGRRDRGLRLAEPELEPKERRADADERVRRAFFSGALIGFLAACFIGLTILVLVAGSR